MNQTTPYQMAINNTARYLRSPENRRGNDDFHLDAFTASEVLAIAFCKAKEEVVADLIHAKLPTDSPK